MNELPQNILDLINDRLDGYSIAMGLRFTGVKPDEVEARMTVGKQHLQPYGIVHGGVHAGMIETLCSAGAAISVYAEGRTVVGLENSTSFLRAVREGELRCVAHPLHRGRTSQMWQAEVYDDRDRLVATGRVRLMVLEKGARVEGAELAPRPDED